MGKPTLREYLLKLAPDISALDLAETYAYRDNRNGLFYLNSDINNDECITTSLIRGIIRVTTKSALIDSEIENLFKNLIINTNFIYMNEYTNEYTGYCEYLFIVSGNSLDLYNNETIIINNPLIDNDAINRKIISVSGVAF